MGQEKFCNIHNDTPTRLSCSSCGIPICPKCAIQSDVGYKCPDCGQRNISHIEKITNEDYVKATISALSVGTITGFIWHMFSAYGAFISLATAYIVGFCIAKSITKVIGNKIGKKIQILAGSIALISMVYNPILIILNLKKLPLTQILIIFTFSHLSYIIGILAVVIAIWATIRHFKI